MSDETAAAFAPLDHRAIYEASSTNPPDRISVRDHVVSVEIGAFQSERDMTQRLRFSVVVEVAPNAGAATDDVDDILSYDAVTEAIETELRAERLNLLETLAERIAARILTHNQPLRVFVRIEKLDRGPGNLGVEILRNRGAVRAQGAHDGAVQASVIYLDDDLEDAALGDLLTQIQDSASPTILCVSKGALPLPELADENAQRHVDLLEIEQTAWRLAARDARLVVVATRTELDWGVKNNQISIWAPSKMVLDAVDGPKGSNPRVLADWLARSLGAGPVKEPVQ